MAAPTYSATQQQHSPRQHQWFLYTLVFLYASGLVAHLVPGLRFLTEFTTDLFLLGINLTLFGILYRNNSDQRLLVWAICTYVLTFFIEALGVATGMVFGEYHYGKGMLFQWLGVPFVIALNWTLLILAVNDLAARRSANPIIASFFAGLMIVVYDWFIEPVAMALDYWQWAGNHIPTQNYLAWGLVAFAASFPLNYYRIRFRHPLLSLYLIVQLIYFIVLQIFL
jgi:putative membrane protein